ncbi:C2 domain protein [Metarhizium robertsii ARSEF 23]|uniref:C2 domain protein n=1 Tax=Metarhizium robertsii (strain ARSEF 23 / ATCC MYA-3075) TaxID=655844 RepID=A0A0B2X757_METRA|nr:C2 domain protein [Metarhizium robertsii ARSEF 23]KHO10733.1 C2 domain protein [Metarhizium robertsii ARSEF 23]
MASAATESGQTVDPSKSKETPTQAAGILTPDTTPAPDDARNAAEQARKAAGIEHEIQRILQSDSDLSTLGVDQNSTPEDRLHALRTLGCKIHHEHSGYGSTKARKEEAEKALKKLCDAAENLGVESPYASAVYHWDGEKNLMAEDSDDEDDENDSANRMDQDSVPVPIESVRVPEPPESVHEIYKKATPFVQQLATDPDDKDSHNGIAALNIEIIKATKEYNELHKDDKAKKVSKTQWEIPLRFFQEHYSLAVTNYNIFMTDPNNDEAREKVETETKLIYDSVMKYHWPEDWILYLTLPEKPSSPSNTNGPFQYPWPTLQTDDGIIVGVRERRVGGPQVCVETTTTDGRIVRRLESASDFGLAEVERYMQIPNYKSLSNAAPTLGYNVKN